jgi:GH24 family phage-related lysozyme (muramidase)
MNYTESEVVKMLKRHEGDGDFKSYKDGEGHLTVGYGHKVKDGDVDINGDPITSEDQVVSKQQADNWFAQDSKTAFRQAKSVYGFNRMSSNRQKAIIDLTYNMGIGWTNKFPSAYKNLKLAVDAIDPKIKAKHFAIAADEFRFKDASLPVEQRIPSKYSNQTKTRAVFITGLLQNG